MTNAADFLELQVRAEVNRRGARFSKLEAAYFPTAPPPLVYRYECLSCRFFERGTDRCEVVGLDTDPGGARVDPAAWCILWLPLRGEAPFAWVGRETG